MKKIFLLLAFGISASVCVSQVVINEYCSSTTTSLDEDGDSPDWIELYNSGTNDVNLEGWALSDDFKNLTKWKFPSVVLPAKSYLLVFASGKDRHEVATGQRLYAHPLVEWGDEFAYAIGSSAIPSNWNTKEFDDSQWSKGPTGIGYGKSGVATAVPNGTISVFARRKFSVDNLNSITRLVLDMDYDDGFVVYINGVEVARENLGTAGQPTAYNELTPNYVNPLIANNAAPARYELSNFKKYLVEGENLIAIQMHNINDASSDLLMIPFLTAVSTKPTSKNVNKVLPEIVKANPNKYLHTNFNISADGEVVYLVDPLGVIVHKTDTTPMLCNVSRGLDANGKWLFYPEPTPETANTTKGFATTRTNEVTFSPCGGMHREAVNVVMKSANGAPIYYTTDGTTPTTKSKLYTEPIKVSKTTVFRAISYCDTLMQGNPSTESYICNGRTIKLPIISLTTDPYNLYDNDYGIYILGDTYEEAEPHYGANYWEDWERPIHVEIYWKDGEKVIDQDAGVKIFGAWSRMSAQKSFALHARRSYGTAGFNYPFFNTKNISRFNSIVLRNSGNDWNYTMFRDAAITGLVRNNNIDIQAYQPAVVYLNGEYWGILNMREKINEDYLEANYPSYVKADEVDILENYGGVVEGTNAHYHKLLNYLRSSMSVKTDMRYDYVKTQMDIDEFIEYMVLQIYCNNGDWPHNNTKFWRPQTTDGRWRWIAYDTDFGFGCFGGGYDTDRLSPNTNSGDIHAGGVLSKLLDNSEFKREFINRFADRLNNEFAPSVVNAYIDSLKNNIATEMTYHISKWRAISNWSSNISTMKTFANNRPAHLRNHIRSRFSVGENMWVTVNVNDSAAGYIQLNSLTIKKMPWSGIYFKNNAVTVRAIARPGYRFVKWKESGYSYPEITVAPKTTSEFTAIFEPTNENISNIVINEINYKSGDEQDTDDWIELYNATASTIDISEWVLTNREQTKPFVIPRGTKIPAYSYLVVCAKKSKLLEYWPNLSNVIGNFKFNLGTTDNVMLFDTEGNLVDDVEYEKGSPWPKQANGDGYTLSLADPFVDNSQPYIWEIGEKFGTPGTENTNLATNHDFTIDNYNSIKNELEAINYALCTPNPFSNTAAIEWGQANDANVQIQLMSAQGALLGTLVDTWYQAGEHSLNFSHIAAQLPAGLYFAKVSIEGYDNIVIKLIKQ